MSNNEIYRPNVAIVILSQKGDLLWCRRKNHDGWQFPQGGIDSGESPEEAIIRETKEEVGLNSEDFKIIYENKEWINYEVPKARRSSYFFQKKKFLGQSQKWFLAELKCDESKIDLNSSQPAEFDDWIWTKYWYPLGATVTFKSEAYRRALIDMMPTYSAFLKRLSG